MSEGRSTSSDRHPPSRSPICQFLHSFLSPGFLGFLVPRFSLPNQVSPAVVIRPPGVTLRAGKNPVQTTYPIMQYTNPGTQGIKFVISSTFPSGNNGAYEWAQLINCDDSDFIVLSGRQPVSSAI